MCVRLFKEVLYQECALNGSSWLSLQLIEQILSGRVGDYAKCFR